MFLVRAGLTLLLKKCDTIDLFAVRSLTGRGVSPSGSGSGCFFFVMRASIASLSLTTSFFMMLGLSLDVTRPGVDKVKPNVWFGYSL